MKVEDHTFEVRACMLRFAEDAIDAVKCRHV